MEARLLIGALAAVSAFACLYLLALAASSEVRMRQTALVSQEDEPGPRALLLWRLRNGFAPLKPLAARLLSVRRVGPIVDELVSACGERGTVTTADALLTVVVAGAIALGVVAGAVTSSLVGAVAVPVCAIAIVCAVAGSQSDKRQEAVREAVPVALESMAACFGSGFTLLQTFEQVSHDVPDPLGATFGRSAHILEMGGSARSALEELRKGAYASELAFVVVALDVQHESGGAMRQVLDAATDTVKGELSLRRALRVQTAQAKLSARVVAVMPFVLIAAFSVVSPDFLSPFFGSAAGYALLALAAGMQVAGIALVRRALSVDGVS